MPGRSSPKQVQLVDEVVGLLREALRQPGRTKAACVHDAIERLELLRTVLGDEESNHKTSLSQRVNLYELLKLLGEVALKIFDTYRGPR